MKIEKKVENRVLGKGVIQACSVQKGKSLRDHWERWFDAAGEKKREDVNGETTASTIIDRRTRIFVDRGGNRTYREYDEWDNLVKEVFPGGAEVTYRYERRFSNLLEKVDERGTVTRYEYDDAGNLIRLIEAAESPAERITEYTYDAAGNQLTVKKVGDALTSEAVTAMEYDEAGNLISVTDPEGNTTRFTHDITGNVLTRTDDRNRTWTYTYDAAGRLTSTADPLRNTIRVFYDAAGNRTKEIDAGGKETTYEYDRHNRLVKRTDPAGDWLYEYDLDGNLLKETDPEGRSVTHKYDGEGRLVKTVDGNGNETATEYGSASGGCSSCAAAAGQPKRIIFPTFTREYTYDRRGRRIEETDILSEEESHTTRFAYDAGGNLTARTDKEERTTAYEYDWLNRLVKEIDPSSKTTEYIYDDRDNLLSLEDARGNVTRFEYDRNNRLTKEIRPLGQETAYGYDQAGNLMAKMDARGQRTEHDYDTAGRLVTTRYFPAEDYVHPAKTVAFTYDDLGNLTGYNDGTTSAEYFYNDSRRKTSETVHYGSFELNYSYAYYANGRKKAFTGPDGITYEYTYDNNNQPATVSIPGQGFITYNSYTWNRPESITLPGGTSREYLYDPLMRLQSIKANDPGQNAIMDYAYTYDRMDNITRKTTEHGDYVYGYDELYRLTSVDNPVLPDEAFTYDAAGNRLTAAETAGTWSYNHNNELLVYGETACEYDQNGNTIKRGTGTDTRHYFYDVSNRLVRVEDGTGGVIASYYYDPFGRRLWKEVGGTKTYFLYADEGLVGEYDGNGQEIKTYGYKPSSIWTTDPLFMKQGGAYYWYHTDYLGTPMQLTNTSGSVVWSAKYKAFGEAEVDSGSSVTNNLRFPGQMYDEETGLHYNWHRNYDPGVGRYLRADPIGIKGGMNLYIYAGCNPLNLIDPMGLKWDWGDFVDHYKYGRGTAVSLLQIGLLSDFIYSDSVSDAFERVREGYKLMLKNRLFAKCTDCETVTDSFDAHHFDEMYDVTWESSNLFSLGDGELFNKGTCSGVANCKTGRWQGSCELHFYIRDWFKRPLDYVPIELGTPYRINGDWDATFSWSE